MTSFPSDQSGKIVFRLNQVTFVRANGPAIPHITWIMRAGECWAITGPGGSGKTTLAEALAGRHRVQAGKISYGFLENPENRLELNKYAALISFQPPERELNYARFYYQQRYNSSETEGIKTVAEFLKESTPASSGTTWDNVLQLLNLNDLLPLAIIKLSNGQTRKMLIARALLREPKLIILDNPFAGLDQQTREDFKIFLQNLTARGTHLVLVTKPTEVPDFITHVLELNQYRIKGTYTRAEYEKAGGNIKAEEEPAFVGPEIQLFTAQPETDFAVAVKFENTTIRYDQDLILENINWTVKKGEKWALSGPNGSGKTTLLSLINGDNPQAFANKIILFDRRKGSGESIWDIKKRIGFVSPELHLYFRQNLTAATVAATGFFDTVYPKRRITTAEDELINHFFAYYGLGGLRQKSFLHLSAGEQRIVLLIRSLVKNPEMLIWDEPYQGLNASLISKTQALLTQYATPAKTIIFVTHFEQEIPKWVKKRIYLEAGRIKNITN